MNTEDYYRSLQLLQAERLKRDYAQLARQPQFATIADFFFNDMYGPHDFSARDTQARRLQQFAHLAPGLTMRDIEVSLELLDVTTALDLEVAQTLHTMNAPIPFNEAMYEQAYFEADAYEPRRKQIELVRDSLTRAHRLTTLPLIGKALANSKTLARLMGMRELHRFLWRGFKALQSVSDAELEVFLHTIETKELRRLNRIYQVEAE